MSFFSGLDFFILLALILIPAIVLGISEVNLRYYRIIASIAILFLIFRDDLRSVVFLIIFVTLEFLLIRVYLRIREAQINSDQKKLQSHKYYEKYNTSKIIPEYQK